MKLFSLKSFVYLAFLLILIAGIEFKKSLITEGKKKEVVSVLGILLKEGAPVEVKTISPTNIENTLKVTLLKCSNSSACFYNSRAIASLIRPGMKVFETSGNALIGQVEKVSNQADYKNGLYRAVVSMNSPAQTFKNESALVAEVLLSKKSKVFAVPVEVVERESNKQYLWIASDGKAQRIEVETGIQNDREIEVKKGLSGGEQVIVKGLSQAHEYDQVYIVNKVSQNTKPTEEERSQENL